MICLLFQMIAFKIYAVIKIVYTSILLSWTSAGNIQWEVFLEINLSQKTLKLYTYWVYWNMIERTSADRL